MVELGEGITLTPAVKGFQLIVTSKKIKAYDSYKKETKSVTLKGGFKDSASHIVTQDYSGFSSSKKKEDIAKFDEIYKFIKRGFKDKLVSEKKNSKGYTKEAFNIFQKLVTFGSENNFNQEDVLNKIDEKKNEVLIKAIGNISYLNNHSRIDLEENYYINYTEGIEGLYFEKEFHNGDVQIILIARMLLKEMTRIEDELDIGLKPVYNLRYYNMVTLKEKELFHLTRDELSEALYEDMCFVGLDANGINKTMGQLFILNANKTYEEGSNKIEFKSTTDVFKDGFYYNKKTGKVVNNNILNGIKPTKENVREAINLVNELITNRGTAKGNECNVFRFMLWSPFSWCFKEIGMSKANYGLVLEGWSGTNKTGSVANFSYLYSSTPEEDIIQTADTVSAFGTRLEENTLPLLLDESRILFEIPDMEEIQKRNIWNKETRSTKQRTGSNRNLDNFIALRMPIYTLNNPPRFKPEFLRRYKINSYDKSMIITEKEDKEFRKKYNPGSPNSPLKVLRYLGKAFADRLIPYIEEENSEIYDIEELTINILKDISDWCNTTFAPSIYHIQDSAEGLEIDEYSLIQKELSKEFNKVHKTNYTGYKGFTEEDFISCAQKNEISWLYHLTTKKTGEDVFAIHKSEFEFYISEICSRSLKAPEIMEIMGIELDENINKEGFNTGFTKGEQRRGFKLWPQQLIYKLFGIEIYKHKDLNEKEDSDKSDTAVEYNYNNWIVNYTNYLNQQN